MESDDELLSLAGINYGCPLSGLLTDALVTYELIHAHFVQDIFEVITIYLEMQFQIAISHTSNFL